MDGAHRLARTGELTSAVLDRVFRVLSTRRVSLEGMLLKPNMVVPGTECPEPVSVTEVATATRRVLRRQRAGRRARDRGFSPVGRTTGAPPST